MNGLRLPWEPIDDVVARDLFVIDWVLRVPLQQHAEFAHVGQRTVGVCRARRDEVQVVGEPQVGFGQARDAVYAAFVANVH